MRKKRETTVFVIALFFLFFSLSVPVNGEIDIGVGTVNGMVRVQKHDGEYGEWKNMTATKMPLLNDIFQVKIDISTNQKCNISYGFHLEYNNLTVSNEEYKIFTCLDEGYEVGNWIQVFNIPAAWSNTQIFTIKQIKNSSDIVDYGLKFIIHYTNKTIIDSFEEGTILRFSHNYSDFDYGINVTENHSNNGDDGGNNTTNTTNGDGTETPGFGLMIIPFSIMIILLIRKYRTR